MGHLRRYGAYNYLNKDAEEEKDAAERAENEEEYEDNQSSTSISEAQFFIMKKFFGF